jgi:stress-induced morphogen
MPLQKNEFENVIKDNFQGSKLILTDMLGDQNHYSLEISSPEFEGLSILDAHKLINARLKDYIGNSVHALTILSINII